MNSRNDLQQSPSLPVDFESVAKKLQASHKRKEKQNSRRNQRYHKKRKDRSRKNNLDDWGSMKDLVTMSSDDFIRYEDWKMKTNISGEA